jgi:hypothetical protein
LLTFELSEKMSVEIDEANKIAKDTSPPDRRAMLLKMGRFGAYTAPALLAIFQSTKAGAVTSAS